jgi:hypothetical protein
MRAWLGLAGITVLLAGCGSSKHAGGTTTAAAPAGSVPTWPAPKDPLGLTRKAGLKPEPHEFFAFHVHAHLDVLVDGQSVTVPAGIGINIADPAVKRFAEPDGTVGYGGISPPCTTPCISPLHTHDDTGILHTESQQAHPNTLGEFFTEWNVRLTPTCVDGYCKRVAFYVNGKRYRGDPRAITLTDMKEIAIVIGRPPSSIPSQFPR